MGCTQSKKVGADAQLPLEAKGESGQGRGSSGTTQGEGAALGRGAGASLGRRAEGPRRPAMVGTAPRRRWPCCVVRRRRVSVERQAGKARKRARPALPGP